jgi:hypothetical protein
MPKDRWQRNSERLCKLYDCCIPSDKACHNGSALGVGKRGKCVIQVHHSTAIQIDDF